MNLNSLLYPAPPASYKSTHFKNELIYVPRVFHSAERKFQKKRRLDENIDFEGKKSLLNQDLQKTNIPCLYLPCATGSSKVLVYFHANAEDIGLAYPLLDCIRQWARVNVLAPEYPGYGLYTKKLDAAQDPKQKKPNLLKCSSKQLREDSEHIYDFILANIQDIKESDIILFGRSMGSGPTCHLASTRSPGAVILMSAYTSIKNVAREKFGLLSALISE